MTLALQASALLKIRRIVQRKAVPLILAAERVGLSISKPNSAYPSILFAPTSSTAKLPLRDVPTLDKMSHCQNGASPVFFQWTNVTINIDQTVTRGFPVGIGTPQQVVSLRPSSSDNNLYVVNAQTCRPTYNDTCEGQFGGLFNVSQSTTYVEVTQALWNGTYEPNPDHLSDIYFNDVLSFGNIILDGYPAFMDQPGYGN